MAEQPGQTRRVIVGALLIAAAIACALLIFFLDELKHAGRDTYRIVAVFAQAPQLGRDAGVWIAGRPVGRVVRVELLPPAADSSPRVAAVLELPAGVQPLIRRDSELRLASERPLGRRVVDLSPGTAAVPALGPGDTLRAMEAAPMRDIAQEAARFAAALDSLVATARTVDALFAARAPAFRRVQRSLEAVSAEFDRLVAGFDGGPLDRFLDDPGWRAALDRIRRASTELAQFFAGAAGTTTAGRSDYAARGAAFRRLAHRTKAFGERLEQLQELLTEPQGFRARLARDSALADALTGARAQIDSLLTEAKEAPWMFVF